MKDRVMLLGIVMGVDIVLCSVTNQGKEWKLGGTVIHDEGPQGVGGV